MIPIAEQYQLSQGHNQKERYKNKLLQIFRSMNIMNIFELINKSQVKFIRKFYGIASSRDYFN